jgi:dihydroneopterin aldolase
MTGMLASVRSIAEARIVLAAGADLIDLKDPSTGALGALNEATVRRVVKFVNGRRPVSATVGDMPCEARLLRRAIEQKAGCGIDFVKVGIFAPDVGYDALRVLERRSTAGDRIVLVFFAEFWRGAADFRMLRGAGVVGVMLDTADKRAGPLTRRMETRQLEAFVETARGTGLLTGLAGSLTGTDARLLTPLQPDYLGFRGALCVHGRRGGRIDPRAVSRLRRTLRMDPDLPESSFARTAA